MRHVIAALVTFGTVVAAQAPSGHLPTFRSEIHYVEVPVRVLDSRGEFVRGLTASDFTVAENRKRQTIVKFTPVDIPFIASDSTTAAAQAAHIDTTRGGDINGRVYLFLLDDLFFEANHTLAIRNLVRRFVTDKMSANDIGAVVLTSGARVQEFTSNRQLLLDAIDHVVGTYDPAAPRHSRVRTMIANLSRGLGQMKDRQKALVVFSSSPPLCLVVPDRTGKLRDDTQRVTCGMMFEAAVQSTVTLYVIDPRGPVAPRCVTAEWSGSSCAGATVRGAVAAWSSPQSGSRTLAEETGGFAAVMTNNFDAVFERIVRENSTYYVIGYYSTNDRPDGKFRSHDIKVNRRDVRVVHRAGYLAPRRE